METRINEIKEMLRQDPTTAHQVVGEVSKMAYLWWQLQISVNSIIDDDIKAKRQLREDINNFAADRRHQIKHCWMICDRDTDRLKTLIKHTTAYRLGAIDEEKLNNLKFQDASSGLDFGQVMSNLYSILK